MEHPIIVTGAAGSIGRALVQRLLAAKECVIALDRVPSQIRTPFSDRLCEITVDLVDHVKLLDVVTTLEGTAPKHVFVVHGGAFPEEVNSDPLRLSPEVFRRTLDMNLVSAYSTIALFAPLVARSHNSNRSFVLVSSINAFSAFGYPAYSAAKAGLESLVKSLSVALAAQAIRINGVALGTVLDPLGSTLHSSELDHFERMRQQSLMREVMSPDTAAETLLSLTQSLNSMTGQVLTADYGQSILRFPQR